MSLTSNPTGLTPSELGGGAFRGAYRYFPLGANNTTAIFTGDPVCLNSGVITAQAATPTTTRSSNTPIGICVGVDYTAPNGKPTSAMYLPANSVSSLGFTNILVKVVVDPNVVFAIQADGAVPLTAQGKNAALKNYGAGSTATGNSKVQLDSATPATTATLAVRIVDFDTTVGNTANDAYTVCLCRWNAGVHGDNNATGG